MNEERAREGVEHLQTAAVEVIAALRAFLDVVEEVVRDPGAVMAMATSVAETATRVATPAPSASNPSDSSHDGDGRVARIRVS